MRQYSLRKREGKRVERWESEFERIVNDSRNVLSMEEVRKQITETLEYNAIEQTKVSLLCPLTKVRIEVPARYRDCRHLQCFDLKAFLAMKAKRNFLACPICNTKIDRELTTTSLCIDKFFQNILSEFSSSTEAVILGDATCKATFSHSALIVPEVIDDEDPYEPEDSTTLKCEVKSETDSDDDDVEVLDPVSNFEIDSAANISDAGTQDAHILYTSMECDASQAVDRSTNVDETDSETGIEFDIDSEANTGNAKAHNLHFPDTSKADDTNQRMHSAIAETDSGGTANSNMEGEQLFDMNSPAIVEARALCPKGYPAVKCTRTTSDNITTVIFELDGTFVCSNNACKKAQKLCKEGKDLCVWCCKDDKCLRGNSAT